MNVSPQVASFRRQDFLSTRFISNSILVETRVSSWVLRSPPLWKRSTHTLHLLLWSLWKQSTYIMQLLSGALVKQSTWTLVGGPFESRATYLHIVVALGRPFEGRVLNCDVVQKILYKRIINFLLKMKNIYVRNTLRGPLKRGPQASTSLAFP